MPSSSSLAKTVCSSISRTFAESNAAIQGAATGYFSSRFHSPNDVLVAQLIAEALAVFDEDGPRARGYIERAHFIMRGRYPMALPGKGMLADWQVRKVVHHIHGNLEAELRMSDAAKRVNLSSGHFSRSFKMTTGLTYSQYVIQARIDLAKHLLQTSEAPISEIALMCGLSDQPHLNRLFRRLVGVPPSTWRRMMAEPPANAN